MSLEKDLENILLEWGTHQLDTPEAIAYIRRACARHDLEIKPHVIVDPKWEAYNEAKRLEPLEDE